MGEPKWGGGKTGSRSGKVLSSFPKRSENTFLKRLDNFGLESQSIVSQSIFSLSLPLSTARPLTSPSARCYLLSSEHHASIRFRSQRPGHWAGKFIEHKFKLENGRVVECGQRAAAGVGRRRVRRDWRPDWSLRQVAVHDDNSAVAVPSAQHISHLLADVSGEPNRTAVTSVASDPKSFSLHRQPTRITGAKGQLISLTTTRASPPGERSPTPARTVTSSTTSGTSCHPVRSM